MKRYQNSVYVGKKAQMMDPLKVPQYEINLNPIEPVLF